MSHFLHISPRSNDTKSKYMIIFGEFDCSQKMDGDSRNSIYVMNLERMEIKLSHIECPIEYGMRQY